MTISHRPASLWVLRWTLGLVVLWQSFHFAFPRPQAPHLEQMQLPSWIGPVLGGAEILAALIFLIPKLERIGGLSLLVTFAIAVVLHVLHRQFQIGSLLVYSAAALACVSRNSRPTSRSAS